MLVDEWNVGGLSGRKTQSRHALVRRLHREDFCIQDASPHQVRAIYEQHAEEVFDGPLAGRRARGTDEQVRDAP